LPPWGFFYRVNSAQSRSISDHLDLTWPTIGGLQGSPNPKSGGESGIYSL
jgi:hypothetical protein